jgi:hypothetical protein
MAISDNGQTNRHQKKDAHAGDYKTHGSDRDVNARRTLEPLLFHISTPYISDCGRSQMQIISSGT